jgi:hypothetical protein
LFFGGAAVDHEIHWRITSVTPKNKKQENRGGLAITINRARLRRFLTPFASYGHKWKRIDRARLRTSFRSNDLAQEASHRTFLLSADRERLFKIAMQTTKHFKTVAFVAYPVSDVKKARAFYENGLELKPTANWEDQWVEYDIGEGTLAICTADKDNKPGLQGATVGLEVVNLDSLMEHLKAKSVALDGSPFDTPVCRGCIVRDPDNNKIILHAKK